MGSDAPIVAKVLVNLPHFFNAYIDVDKAAVVGQPPPYLHTAIYKIISSFDVKLPLGELIFDSYILYKTIPPLWLYVDGRRWTWAVKERCILRRISLKDRN